MKRFGLALAIALIVAGNIFALIGVQRNRSGTPLETIELTERELTLQSQPEDNSGITLRLAWLPRRFGTVLDTRFNAEKLRELGFDCTIPADSGLEEKRLLPRPAYAVLEYQGAKWEQWRKEREDAATAIPQDPSTAARARVPVFNSETRLFFVDAGKEAAKLLSKYPDRSKYLVVRAVIAAALYSDNTSVKSWHGWVSEILPSEIHVPLPFAAILSGLGSRAGDEPRYAVTLRYGRSLEPWVADVKRLGRN